MIGRVGCVFLVGSVCLWLVCVLGLEGRFE
jgi:hypothetical protein